MKSADIRRSFLEYFGSRGHAVRPSSSLVPASDPTLLFTNAGMVQFKGAFLGAERPGFARAVTAQKCVRAGGKHNDLEEVGRTARHHTFFEMLGNFSFGDYFKREAIGYGWEFLTGEMGLDSSRLFVTVHHTDDEAARLWTEVAGVPAERIHHLGDKDNFWQMADTGPCGPCSEVHYDLRPAAERGTLPSTEEFEVKGEAGEFLELWNLVFMQFDRDDEGVQRPLPAPSIDTGLGLERLAAVMQGADSNYHTDLFAPLLERVAEVTGRPYDAAGEDGVSCRVMADHARAVAFLLADGVFPSNEGRGYVLRRILRRGVRHAWLLGRREPTLAPVVDAVVDEMGGAYPELEAEREGILAAALREEERFLATIGGGMERLRAIAPARVDASAGGRGEKGDAGSAPGRAGSSAGPPPVIPGAEVFQLYDTFGFPLDLTRLVAAERGYRLDEDGFAAALEEQRSRSRRARASAAGAGGRAGAADGEIPDDVGGESRFVGYDALEVAARVLWAARRGDEASVVLDCNPFYVEGGGQVSDTGRVAAADGGWSLAVEQVIGRGDVVELEGRHSGAFDAAAAQGAAVRAAVRRGRRRDTERNHTATHLLHAALRSCLGRHVRQRGSLVAPDRLRFDFSHDAPMTRAEVEAVSDQVARGVWSSFPVETSLRPHAEAVAAGAMALFGERYGDEVRVVEVPGVSMELCGGTHVRRTGEIGPFVIVSESGVAAGVRRIEALTGRRAFEHLAAAGRRLGRVATAVRAAPDHLERAVKELLKEKAALESMVDELQKEGGGGERILIEAECSAGGARVVYRGARLKVRGARDVRAWGDRFRESVPAGVAVVAAEMPAGRHVLFAFAADAAIAAGVRADAVVREVAAAVGGRGGGRPHMAQAGVEDPEGLDQAVRGGAGVVEGLVGAGSRR